MSRIAIGPSIKRSQGTAITTPGSWYCLKKRMNTNSAGVLNENLKNLKKRGLQQFHEIKGLKVQSDTCIFVPVDSKEQSFFNSSNEELKDEGNRLTGVLQEVCLA